MEASDSKIRGVKKNKAKEGTQGEPSGPLTRLCSAGSPSAPKATELLACSYHTLQTPDAGSGLLLGWSDHALV